MVVLRRGVVMVVVRGMGEAKVEVIREGANMVVIRGGGEGDGHQGRGEGGGK